MADEEEGDRREAAIAARPSLQHSFKPPGVTQSQLSKFQELHRRRLQIKARSKIKNKAKGTSNVSSKSHVKNLDANDFERESLSKESDEAGISFSGGNSMKDTISLQQENVAVRSAPIKRQKLHWGLDVKERWERKANM
ncbi:uncharacterized protein LOC127803994 [Diospyros lotus]|uniref:uncharacterized protein LOC127803994 n=1 Tax=Diospyros lotus TaxID=55363 RepID=UPI00225BA7C5|nr:uncharacterized protein LOC127803994 [Diospyros lotus]